MIRPGQCQQNPQGSSRQQCEGWRMRWVLLLGLGEEGSVGAVQREWCVGPSWPLLPTPPSTSALPTLGPLTTASGAHTQACPGNTGAPSSVSCTWGQPFLFCRDMVTIGTCPSEVGAELPGVISPVARTRLWTGVPALRGWHSSWETAQITGCSSRRGLGWALLGPPPSLSGAWARVCP